MKIKFIVIIIMLYAAVVAVRGESCTGSFPSLAYIDVLEGRTHVKLVSSDSNGLQALIPSMNFTKRGSITKWIVGAEWTTDSPEVSHTELQIWRKQSDHAYVKVSYTTLMIDSSNANGVYEYDLSSPLEFEAGDVFGFHQPFHQPNIKLYLMESQTSVESFSTTCNVDRPLSLFSISSQDCLSRPRAEPLVSVTTEPVDGAQGFLKKDDIVALLEASRRGQKSGISNHQFIFPDHKFECSGEIVKWTVGGFDWNGPYSAHLQIWTKKDNGLYSIKNTSALSFTQNMWYNSIFEQDVDPPLPFEAGDVLGAFQPWFSDSKVQLHIDTSKKSLFFAYSTYNEGYISPQHSLFNIRNATTSTGVLLVTIETSNAINTVSRVTSTAYRVHIYITPSAIDLAISSGNLQTKISQTTQDYGIRSTTQPVHSDFVKVNNYNPEMPTTWPVSPGLSTTVVHTETPTTTDDRHNSLEIIIGSLTGVLLVSITLLVLLTAAVIIKQRRKGNHGSDHQTGRWPGQSTGTIRDLQSNQEYYNTGGSDYTDIAVFDGFYDSVFHPSDRRINGNHETESALYDYID